MNWTEIFLFYLSLLATAGLAVKVYQIFFKEKFK